MGAVDKAAFPEQGIAACAAIIRILYVKSVPAFIGFQNNGIIAEMERVFFGLAARQAQQGNSGRSGSQ